MHRRILDGWNSIEPESKLALLAAAATIGTFILNARDGRLPAVKGEAEAPDPTVRKWTNHAGGYYVCEHVGCAKKANWKIPGHDCCGRCRRGTECIAAAYRDYSGPGGSPHEFAPTLLYPDTCCICDEAEPGHPTPR
ncbi:hypothetical protein [Streptomyces xanthophaeus]